MSSERVRDWPIGPAGVDSVSAMALGIRAFRAAATALSILCGLRAAALSWAHKDAHADLARHDGGTVGHENPGRRTSLGGGGCRSRGGHYPGRACRSPRAV